MQSIMPPNRSRPSWARRLSLITLTPLLLFALSLPAYAQATTDDPWENAVNVLKTAFTGTIATGLSLVAIVVGGLAFAYGEGQSKKTLAGIVFGVGMAIGAVKFASQKFGIEDLIGRRTLSGEQAKQLIASVRKGDNILIAGGSGAGKSTLLNVLADYIPDEERILVIEDTAELRIRKPHVISAEAQLDTHQRAITFDDLLRSILRHRPDRILVGEVRGAEARTLLDAMNTGHRGTLATIHANSAEEALRRLGSLALRGDRSSNARGVRDEVHRCLNLVVHIARIDGRRLVGEIHKVAP